MPRRIGIVTITKGTNYGNKLQNYALVYLLKKMGYQPYTINDTTEKGFADSIEDGSLEKKLNAKYIQDVIKARMQYKYHKKNASDGVVRCIFREKKMKSIFLRAEELRNNNFQKFSSKYLNYADFTLSATQIVKMSELEKFDAFICGSDQVWNPMYQDVSKIRFLTFAPVDKRIALSPSFGVEKIPELRKKIYEKWLNEIKFLSVREESGAKIIKKLTGKSVPVLIDPTLMLSAEEWDEIAKKPEKFEKSNYLLTYFLGYKSKAYEKKIKEIAHTNGYEIVDLGEIAKTEFYPYGPAEFLWLIKHAEYVCTDSFHGTVFSIIYKKKFVTFSREENGFGNDNRVMTLLKKLNLKSTLWSENKKENWDYTHIDELLNIEKNKFYEFLYKSLNQACKTTDSSISSVKNVMELNIIEKSNCSGCGGCKYICPVNAIEIQTDVEGFCYPLVDADKCVNCSKCVQYCEKSIEKDDKDVFKAYAAINKDSRIRKSSSSGGVFSLLAEYIISLGGCVFGAAFDAEWNLRHMCIKSNSDIYKMMGSKYIQSDLGECFETIKQILCEERYVLFTGTPCQCAALKKYIGKNRFLITVDFICHGVPSQLAFRTYLNEIVKKRKIISICFRDKSKGWENFSMKIAGEDFLYNKDLYHDEFLRAFLNNSNLRYSCYECKYKTGSHITELTIGDLWGASRLGVDSDNDGISLILVQNEMGKDLINKLSDKMVIQDISVKDALSFNSAALNSVLPPLVRGNFYDKVKTSGFVKTVNDLYPITVKDEIGHLKEKIYRIIYR